MFDFERAFAEIRQVLQHILDWREGLNSIATYSRTNKQYRKFHHDIEHEEWLWEQLLSSDLSRDFRRVEQWALKFLRLIREDGEANVLWLELEMRRNCFRAAVFVRTSERSSFPLILWQT